MACLIKICGITHAASVAAAVHAGADALGFVFAPSVRRVGTRQAAILANRLPVHVRRVAVMQHPDAELWREVETIFCPDVLQTDAEDFDYLEVAPEIERWPVVRESSDPSMPPSLPPGTFLYEGRTSGRGESVDWAVAAAIAKRGRMILAGGLSEANVVDALRVVQPFGVDVSSGVEATPGVKDPALIERFVAAVRAAECT